MEKIKIILADDHRLFRDGVRSILSNQDHVEIIHEVSSGVELIESIKTHPCDIVISDISMPEINGIEAAQWIYDNKPEINVLILSMHINEAYIHKSMKAGVKGYLPKDVSKEELLLAIQTIYEGKEYFGQEISDLIFKSYVKETKMEAQGISAKVELTNRELEIVKLVAEGLLNKEISDQLKISIRTVDTHKANIIQKLKLKSSIDIVKYAIKNGIIEL